MLFRWPTVLSHCGYLAASKGMRLGLVRSRLGHLERPLDRQMVDRHVPLSQSFSWGSVCPGAFTYLETRPADSPGRLTNCTQALLIVIVD